MTIKIGESMPHTTLKALTSEGMVELDTNSLFQNRKVVLFSVPGAFTPTCSAKHLPGYINNLPAFQAKGVDEIMCLAVNDPFVMKHWSDTAHADGKVRMLPDGNGTLTAALGLELDASGFGLGRRGQRFAMVIENGTVTDLQVEAGGEFRVSSAEHMLERL